MNRKSKVLIYILATLVLLTAAASYYRIFVSHDYLVVPLEDAVDIEPTEQNPDA